MINQSIQRKGKFLIVGTLGVMLVLALATYVTLFHFGTGSLNALQIRLKDNVVTQWQIYIRKQAPERQVLVSYPELLGQLNVIERHFVQRLFAQDPKRFGFQGGAYPVSGQPQLVKIAGRYYRPGGLRLEISPQYVPQEMYADLQALQAHMKRDLKQGVLVLSGWRSPAYQAYLFLSRLERYQNSIAKTLSLVAFPHYSEHASEVQPAVDFIAESGAAGDRFVKVSEYWWLLQWGKKYHFYLSYPEGGSHPFEPAHWHWRRPTELSR